MKALFLVSQSPRRIELLRRFGYVFQVISTEFREDKSGEGTPDLALENARGKLREAEDRGEGVYLASDTIVYLDGLILGKPGDREEARDFLRRLSGKVHHVYTGIAVREIPSGRVREELVDTAVKFRDLEEDEIEMMLSFDDPLDKAGAYAIQGIAGLFIESISGSYYNVVGLPMERVYPALKDFGITPVLLSRNRPR